MTSEVLLDFSEVGEQFAGGGRELLESVANTRWFEHRQLACLNGGDLGVELVTAAAKVGEPAVGVGLGALNDLAQQLNRGV